MSTNDKPRVIENHDWISVAFGRHRLTVSWGGFKSSGAVPNSLFDLWVAAMDGKPEALAKIGAVPGKGKLAVAEAFAAKIDELWPEWTVGPYIPAVGAKVSCFFGKRKGTDVGVVLGIKRNYADVQWEREGRCSVQFDMLRPAA